MAKPKKPEKVEPIVRSWEKEVRLTQSQLDALNRGATIRTGSQDGTIVVIVGPEAA